MKTKLFVSNLHSDTTAFDLAEHFRHKGRVKSAAVVTDIDGNFRGFGFVEMFETADAELCLSLSGDDICGRNIKVSYAQDKRPRA